MSQNESIFKKRKLDPAEALLFGGFEVQGTTTEIEKIKQYILEETSAKLIYQHRDFFYLQILRGVPGGA